jgi:hypothetical protein
LFKVGVIVGEIAVRGVLFVVIFFAVAISLIERLVSVVAND